MKTQLPTCVAPVQPSFQAGPVKSFGGMTTYEVLTRLSPGTELIGIFEKGGMGKKTKRKGKKKEIDINFIELKDSGFERTKPPGRANPGGATGNL